MMIDYLEAMKIGIEINVNSKRRRIRPKISWICYVIQSDSLCERRREKRH